MQYYHRRANQVVLHAHAEVVHRVSTASAKMVDNFVEKHLAKPARTQVHLFPGTMSPSIAGHLPVISSGYYTTIRVFRVFSFQGG